MVWEPEVSLPPRGAGRSGWACIYFTCLTYACIVLYIQDSIIHPGKILALPRRPILLQPAGSWEESEGLIERYVFRIHMYIDGG